MKLGAINSINWARVLAQITYYFYSWLRATDDISDKAMKINFAVPTGNFGDILAGYYAKRMGLPVGKLIVCTNENDVLHRFLETGSYVKSPATLSIAPSMDISVSSNFERYLFYLGGSAETLASWMDTFEKTGEVTVSPKLLRLANEDFASASSSKEEIITAMREINDNEKYLVCPHTATAIVAVNKLKLRSFQTICLATAHPAKFEEAVHLALTEGREVPPRPKILNDLFSMTTRTTHLPNELKAVESFVKQKLVSTNKQKLSSMYYTMATFTAFAAAGIAVYFIYASSSKKGR